ncbi:hypothetical protein N8Z70_01675 [Candidatus Puniceispirillum sp.]|nr:hypothetical protein [Alphaproteobacteria bacterium]MDC1293736.1 hypothetical protein [Candidatus Puniceispirillum sp.]
MNNLVILSENPAFIVVITLFALLVLFSGFVTLNLLIKINRLESHIKTIQSDGADTADGLIKFSLRWDEWIKRFEKFIAINDQIISAIEQVRSEQEFIAKAFGNEKKLSKAIELARIGSKADDITIQTGISADEAAVVVKFHGPK